MYLFGSEGNNYSVNVRIRLLPTYTTIVSKNGTFLSLHHKSNNFWGFDVLLEPPVCLIKGKCYHIAAAISGPASFFGRHGNIHIESSGVTFNFENFKYPEGSFDGTCVEEGQLPEFIFKPQE